jgi:hypothetical protein
MAGVTLYTRVDGTLYEVGGSGGTVAILTLSSTARDSILTAGTEFEVPSHTVGNNSLQVYLDGLLCTNGNEYEEASSTAVTFTSDIAADVEILAVVTDPAGSTITTRTQTDASHAAYAEGDSYGVPSYSLGAGALKVYLDGLIAVEGVTYKEVTSTTISWLTAIPATTEIYVVASTIN